MDTAEMDEAEIETAEMETASDLEIDPVVQQILDDTHPLFDGTFDGFELESDDDENQLMRFQEEDRLVQYEQQVYENNLNQERMIESLDRELQLERVKLARIMQIMNEN
jgi:hypothetical protein